MPLHLTAEQYDDAVRVIAETLYEFRHMRTNIGLATMVLEGLGASFDIRYRLHARGRQRPLGVVTGESAVTTHNVDDERYISYLERRIAAADEAVVMGGVEEYHTFIREHGNDPCQWRYEGRS